MLGNIPKVEEEGKKERGKYYVVKGDIQEFATKADLQRFVRETELEKGSVIFYGRKKELEVKQKTYVTIV